MNYTEALKHEIEAKFIKSSGPGGQNVNKRNTAAQIRWNLWNSHFLTDFEKLRIASKLTGLITNSGELIIKTTVSRDQEKNLQMAIEKLSQMLKDALSEPTKRIKTRPTYGSKQRRLASKKREAEKKKLRKKDY